MGSRCLGSPGPALRVSGPFPFAAPSLFCSAPLSQLQPQFHRGWLCRTRCPPWWRRRPLRSRLLPQGFTVASLSPPRSPGIGDQSSISRASTVGWSSPIFTWRQPNPFSSLSAQGTGWYPWTSRFRYIQLLAVTCGFAWGMRCTSFTPCASVSRQHLRCSPHVMAPVSAIMHRHGFRLL